MTEEELIDFFQNLLQELKENPNPEIDKKIKEKLEEIKMKQKIKLTKIEFYEK